MIKTFKVDEPTKGDGARNVKRLRKIVLHLREHNVSGPVLKLYEKQLEKAERQLRIKQERALKE